jgi:flagellar P-ring protein precursor FlgI
MKKHISIAALFILALGTASPAKAARLKELVEVEGFRTNALVGVGIVVGLAGTGDDASSFMAKRPLATVMKNLGTTIEPGDIKSKNVAIVMVTANLPAFARPGVPFDITVSSAGTAKSLTGGTLLATALKAVDRQTYALAQGQLVIGGYEVSSAYSGSMQRKNHVTVARIPGGAIVEREVAQAMPTKQLVLHLKEPDFTTASRVAQAIDALLGAKTAHVRDPGSVNVTILPAWDGRVVELVANIEALEATPDAPARVVIDERTGTIVVGANVVLGSAAIAYGGISISIKERFAVSQPESFARGDTTIVPESDIQVDEQRGELKVIAGAGTVADVAKALNTLGVRPRDLVPIFQALRASGSLRAEIQVL